MRGEAWLKAADEDAIVARAVASIAPGAAAFHWQQAAEKLLKALLAAVEADVPRTHDLVNLWNTLVAHDILPAAEPSLVATLRRVGRLALLGRYPLGDVPPSENITTADLQEAEDFHGSLSILVRRSLNNAFIDGDEDDEHDRDRSP